MKYKIIVIFILISLLAKSQGGFTRQYQLANSIQSTATDAFEAPNGNIILTGTTIDTLKNTNVLCIVGLDANGNFLWRKDYGRSTFQYLNNGFISRNVITDDNHFYLYNAVVDSNGKYFSAFIKFDYNGDTLWQKKYYNSTGHLYVQGATKSIDNGFLMTGFFEETPRTTLLIKTDHFGNELWRKKIQKGSGINTQAGHKIIQDSAAGKIVIAGYQYDADNVDAGGFSSYANIIVTDSQGTVLSKAVYSGNAGSGFRDLIQTRDKKCVAVGYNGQWAPPGIYRKNKGYAVKFDLNNPSNFIWKKEFDTISKNNHILALCELNNGDLVLTGILDTLINYNIGNKPTMTRIIKLDKNGNLKWKRFLQTDTIMQNTKQSGSINKTTDGGFVMPYQMPYLFSKIQPYGIIKIDSTACDTVAAWCKQVLEVGLKDLYMTHGFSLNFFPNPATNVVNVKVDAPGDKTFKLIINDISGRQIENLNLNSKAELEINTTTYKSGAYFLSLYYEGRVVKSKKLLILK